MRDLRRPEHAPRSTAGARTCAIVYPRAPACSAAESARTDRCHQRTAFQCPKGHFFRIRCACVLRIPWYNIVRGYRYRCTLYQPIVWYGSVQCRYLLVSTAAWAWSALAGRKAIPWLLARFRDFLNAQIVAVSALLTVFQCSISVS